MMGDPQEYLVTDKDMRPLAVFSATSQDAAFISSRVELPDIEFRVFHIRECHEHHQVNLVWSFKQAAEAAEGSST